MAENENNEPITSLPIEKINETDSTIDPANLSLEALILLINTERLKQLQDKSFTELSELKDRQAFVSKLHTLMQKLNAATGNDGKLTISDEVKKLLEEAKEAGIDVDLKKTTYISNERDRLLENIRMHIEDLNTQNDMQLQTVSRLTNERYESYQMAKSIMDPLHRAKSKVASNISGR